MKICVVATTFPAISETFVLDQVTALIDLGHEVQIFACKGSGDGPAHAATVFYKLDKRTRYWGPLSKNPMVRAVEVLGRLIRRRTFPLRWRALLSTLNIQKYGRDAATLRLMSAALEVSELPSRPDVFLCHHGNNGRLLAILRELKFIDGEILTVFHGADLSSYLKTRGENVYRNLFSQGALFMPISERLRAKLIALGADKDRIRVHHMGIDCHEFSFSPRAQERNRPFQFISVARFVEKKGLEYAIRAFADVLKVMPKSQYLIVGEGPLSERLKLLVSELDIGTNIHFLGWKTRDEVRSLLAASDVLLAPSVTSSTGDEEGIPVSIMEAMASGLPVIATRHSGIPELIEDGASGFLVDERDPVALAATMKQAATGGFDLNSVAYAARIKVEKEFDNRVLNVALSEIVNSFAFKPGR